MKKIINTLILCMCTFLFLNLYTKPTAADNAKIESSNDFENSNNDTKNIIKEFPVEVQNKLVTQASELDNTINVINNNYGNFENFMKNGTVHLTDDGLIVVGLKSDLEEQKANTIKSTLKSTDEDNLIQFRTIKYSTEELEDFQDDVTLMLH